MRIESALLGALAVTALLTLTPTASADPAEPAPAPDSVASESVVPVAPAAPADPAAASAASAAVPHLVSPENLPPGASVDPVLPEDRNLGYLRDLWHAVQTQEVSGGDALLLLTQRPMDAYATPPPGLASGPQGPAPEPGPQ